MVNILKDREATTGREIAGAPPLNRVYVCQEDSDDNPLCQYFGGEGLAQAVKDSNSGSVIVLETGKYTRNTYDVMQIGNENRRCFLAIKNKNLTFITDNIIDEAELYGGGNSPEMEGMCIDESDINIINIKFNSFLKSSNDTGPISEGNAILIDWGNIVNLKVINSLFINNARSGIGQAGDGSFDINIYVYNSIFLYNLYGLASNQNESPTNKTHVFNSIFDNNAIGANLSFFRNNKTNFTNNIFYSNHLFGNNPLTGYGIITYLQFVDCINYQLKPDNSIEYNLFYNNDSGDGIHDSVCGLVLPEYYKSLTGDPQFGLRYRLEPGSIATDNGHPDIYDIDGTRSDMGIYGGPCPWKSMNEEQFAACLSYAGIIIEPTETPVVTTPAVTTPAVTTPVVTTPAVITPVSSTTPTITLTITMTPAVTSVITITPSVGLTLTVTPTTEWPLSCGQTGCSTDRDCDGGYPGYKCETKTDPAQNMCQKNCPRGYDGGNLCKCLGKVCGEADRDGNNVFNYVDFDAFAKVYNNACSDERPKGEPCGPTDVNGDNFLNYIDFDSFAKRYYPFKANCYI